MSERPPRISVNLTREPIDYSHQIESLRSDDCGAILTFLGSTRRWTHGERTEVLYYEAYESMALEKLREIATEAAAKFDVRAIDILHRIGDVPVMEDSISVVIASAHRMAAFNAGPWIMDTIKRDVPIWKCDRVTDIKNTGVDDLSNSSIALDADVARWVHPS